MRESTKDFENQFIAAQKLLQLNYLSSDLLSGICC